MAMIYPSTKQYDSIHSTYAVTIWIRILFLLYLYI
jgi:hypothetical protein